MFALCLVDEYHTYIGLRWPGARAAAKGRLDTIGTTSGKPISKRVFAPDVPGEGERLQRF